MNSKRRKVKQATRVDVTTSFVSPVSPPTLTFMLRFCICWWNGVALFTVQLGHIIINVINHHYRRRHRHPHHHHHHHHHRHRRRRLRHHHHHHHHQVMANQRHPQFLQRASCSFDLSTSAWPWPRTKLTFWGHSVHIQQSFSFFCCRNLWKLISFVR